MSRMRRVSGLAGLAAGGLLLGSIGDGGAANAAVMVNEFGSIACAVGPNACTVGDTKPAGYRVANEIGTAIVVPVANAGTGGAVFPPGCVAAIGGGASAALGPRICFVNTISSSDNLVIVFTLGGGATFSGPVSSTDLKPFNGCVYGTIGVGGGTAGSSSVTFTLGSQTAGTCVNGTGVYFDLSGPKLKYPSGNVGATTITATMNYASGAVADNNVTPGSVTLLTFGDANRATFTNKFLALDVSTGNTKFFVGAGSDATSPTTGPIGQLTDKVNNCTVGPSGTVVTPVGDCATVADDLFYNETLLEATPFSMTGASSCGAGCTGTLVLAGLPSAVTGAGSVKLSPAGTTSCTAPAAGSSTCTIPDTDLSGVGVTSKVWDINLTIDGVTTIPNTTVTGSFTVKYSPAPYILDTKIPAGTLVGTIGTRGCAIEFNTVLGANSGGAGNVATYRLSNTSNKASRVFMSFVRDSGVGLPAFQVTNATYPVGSATLISMGTAMPGDLLQPGATVEFFSADFPAMGANAPGITGNYGARGRVRFFVETSAQAAPSGSPASEGSLGGQYQTGAAAGCTAEAFMCTGSPLVCSIFKPEVGGLDGQIIKQPNR